MIENSFHIPLSLPQPTLNLSFSLNRSSLRSFSECYFIWCANGGSESAHWNERVRGQRKRNEAQCPKNGKFSPPFWKLTASTWVTWYNADSRQDPDPSPCSAHLVSRFCHASMPLSFSWRREVALGTRLREVILHILSGQTLIFPISYKVFIVQSYHQT